MERKKKLIFIKKFTPLLYDLVLAALCVYIGLRGRQWFNMFLPFESGFIIAALLLIFYVCDLMAVNKAPLSRKRAFVYPVSVCTFLLIYFSVTILAADIIRLIAGIFCENTAPGSPLFFVLGLLCLISTAAAAVLGNYRAEHPVTVKYEADCKKLKKDCRIALLTDLHVGYFVGRKHIQRVVEKVNALRPDIVLISGDTINSGNTRECSELTQVAEELRKLKSKKGTYAVTGNHDPVYTEPDFRAFLEKSGIKLLNDEFYTDDDFQILGRGTRTKPHKSIEELMPGADSEKPLIVLDHDPMGIKDARKAGADLVLCGHTHRGQVWPLNILVRFLYKKDETWGMSKAGNTVSVVSAGAGFFSMPMRTGSESEVVCIDMRAGG